MTAIPMGSANDLNSKNVVDDLKSTASTIWADLISVFLKILDGSDLMSVRLIGFLDGSDLM